MPQYVSQITLPSGDTYNIKDAEARTTLSSKADSVSPTLTGTPTAPTATAGTNTTQIATTAFVQNAISTSNSPEILISTTAPAATDSYKLWIQI